MTARPEALRRRRAARLMYDCGCTREDADALTHAANDGYPERTLIALLAAYRDAGLTDPEIVKWWQAGFDSPPNHDRWVSFGYTPADAATIRDFHNRNPNVLTDMDLDDLICDKNTQPDFFALVIRAGPKTKDDIDFWLQRHSDGEDLYAELSMLAGLIPRQ